MKITQKKLTSDTQHKHAMTFLLYGKTSFKSHENSSLLQYNNGITQNSLLTFHLNIFYEN
jgi:hypothetical protein